MLDAARAAGVPAVHTGVRFTPGGADGAAFPRKVGALRHFVGDTPLGAIRTEVAPLFDLQAEYAEVLGEAEVVGYLAGPR